MAEAFVQRYFSRVAIVNRGEPAMRLIHAVREWNRERGEKLVTIALYTDPDRRAMFVREADDAVSIGPATFVDPRDGHRRVGYLDYGRLERALVASRAEAAWVGWGFVAEHAEFAELCGRLGVVFIGPSPDVMRKLGDKITSKRLAEQAGVPVAPWSGGPIDDLETARREAGRIGYPLMIKATAGGGGRGIREVRSAAELEAAWQSARAEARSAFGDPTVFLERRIEGARHIEVQVIGDHSGHVWACGVRDCTIQRRHQKIVEEAPSPVLSSAQDEEIRAAAVRLARAAGYQNAGTVEFLYEPAAKRFAFMEVNARLQVEHPVTEVTTGVDLVKLQIHAARGGALEGDPPPARGHAIEVRLNAEDPERDFSPAPGRVDLFRVPTGPGLRIELGVAEGDEIPAEFDSMIAKIIAWGRDRGEALARLSRALSDSTVVLRGGTSNKAFLLDLLARPELVQAEADNGWLDRLAARGDYIPRAHAGVALVAAAIEAYGVELGVERAQFLASAARGRPKIGQSVGHATELCYRGHTYKLHVHALGPRSFRIHTEDGGIVHAQVEPMSRFERRIVCEGRHHRVVSMADGLDHLIEVDGVPHHISLDAGGVVRAPAPGVVTQITVAPGDEIAAGDRVAVLEAMKMEMAVTAPLGGRVREVFVTSNVQVPAGTPLMLVEASGSAHQSPSAERVCFTVAPASGAQPPRARRAAAAEALERLVLGFDIDAAAAKRALEAWCEGASQGPPDDPDLLRSEHALLSAFADIHALFRRQPVADDPDGPQTQSTEEHLVAYLRDLTSRGERLPSSFTDKLKRALAHYGTVDIDPSPELEDTLLRIYKSHERAEEQLPAVSAVLDRRLLCAGALVGEAGDPFHRLLNGLIANTHRRFPAIHDLAREVRHVYFDQPLFERAKEAIYEKARACLAAIQDPQHDDGREVHACELVECPQPIAGLLAQRFEQAGPDLCAAMLDVLLRRYYRIRNLTRVQHCHAQHQVSVTAEYEHEGSLIHAIATHARYDRLGEAVQCASALAASLSGGDVVVDFYVWSPVPLGDPDAAGETIRAALAAASMREGLRRIVVAVAGPGRAATSQCFTYRPAAEGGYAEQKLYRGLHPMIAKRLQLWRLCDFDLERLPSVEDVYLFRGVAHENPKDERLFALAEVRDLTPVHDESGRVIQLPYLERMLMEATSAIRSLQMRRPVRERLQWNRILLYLWPPLRLEPADLKEIVDRLAPATVGLGLEQVVVQARMPAPSTGELRDTVIRISSTPAEGLQMTFADPSNDPIATLSEYEQKVIALRRRGLTYPYEIVRMLAPGRNEPAGGMTRGEFVEYDLNASGQLGPVDRPAGKNTANIVAGVVKSFTPRHPEGMTRIILLGDAGKEMGSLAEPECRRIMAALDLARRMRVPLEWFALSAGAKISMQSGTENMDWIALVLRRLIEHTQAGCEVNVIICGITVGAQPYWNAESTMLMHTRGILIMTEDAAMVLTGKQALDYSGSVSAEDNQGIGGYERIMGPNGQAQYWAEDIAGACRILMRHYEHTYVMPGERFPRRAATSDSVDRDIRTAAHAVPPWAIAGRIAAPAPARSDGFATVGDVFSDEKNPGRKRPFDIRAIMGAAVDQDHLPLERWRDMRDAETAVVWDARVGGFAVCMLGIESRPIPRLGFLPADGPEQWTAGTLFPLSSKKVARAINAASGNRPVVVMANLSGFDGSPESMRCLQLEYGAEIGRAVVNFDGPMVFCVVSRYHGGAFVVFSKRLNDQLEVAALEGAHASVIGGAPAAAVVFSREVDARTAKDSRMVELEQQLARAPAEQKAALRARLAEIRPLVRSEKLGQVADEFDRIHCVERALQVGSLDRILPVARLRPYLVDALERGMARATRAKAIAGP